MIEQTFTIIDVEGDRLQVERRHGKGSVPLLFCTHVSGSIRAVYVERNDARALARYLLAWVNEEGGADDE